MPLVDLPDHVPAPAELGAVHLIGVGGAGMSGIARLLVARGHTVSGCDTHDSDELAALRALGVRCHVGHDPEHVARVDDPEHVARVDDPEHVARVDGVDTVVVSSAIRPDNPELLAARAGGLRVLPRASALASLMSASRQLAIAGTHGKTTTTAMCVAALDAAGLDPSYAIGGQLAADGGNARVGSGDVFVAEADESDGSFLAYRPSGAVITNVEADHLDAYGTVAAYRAAFVAFVERIQPGGFLVVCADDPGAAALAGVGRDRGLRVLTYGEAADAHVRVAGISSPPAAVGAASSGTANRGGPRITATVVLDGQPAGRLALAVPGRHNVLDAAGALAAGIALGAPVEQLLSGLGRFSGTRRRLELRGRAGGVDVVDSYAHHPTEVTADLRAARDMVPDGGRLVVAFQPHLYSRTRLFAGALGQALGLADVVVVTDVYAAREDPDPAVTGRLVADAVPLPGEQVGYEPALARLPTRLARLARSGDLVLTLGAGDITTVGPEVLALLRDAEGTGGESTW